jgi:steroid delta-isomerase-like uncharacterized protein
MSQQNLAVMRAALDAMNRRDLDACVAMLTPDFVISIAGAPPDQRGPSAWRRNAEMLFKAFPDARIHIDDMFASDDKVAVRVRITGTHTGPFLGVEPTGKPIAYESNELYRIVDGRIAQEWICSDMLTMMTQIGAYPAQRLLTLWLAGYRVWFAGALGLAAGAGLAALLV